MTARSSDNPTKGNCDFTRKDDLEKFLKTCGNLRSRLEGKPFVLLRSKWATGHFQCHFEVAVRSFFEIKKFLKESKADCNSSFLGSGADPGGCNGCASTRQSCKEIIEGKLPIIFCCKVFD